MKQIQTALLLCTLLTATLSCSDELAGEGQGGNGCIGFTPSTRQTWAAMQPDSTTRSSADTTLRRHLALVEGTDSLWVQTDVAEGIRGGKDAGEPTRGVVYDSSSDPFYPSFGVFTYAYQGDWNNTQKPDYMYNVECRRTKSGIYTPVQTYYWPSTDYNIRFYAYAPYSSYINVDGTNLTLSAKTATNVPLLTYTVPDEAADQRDIMVADSRIEDASTPRVSAWDLDFRHILCAVQVKVGEGFPDGVIKRVSLKNVYKRGTFKYRNYRPNLTTVFNNDTWQSLTQYSGTVFTQELDFDTKDHKGEYIIDGKNTWLMIPSSFQTTATLEVEFVKEGATEPTTYSIKLNTVTGATSWQMGKTYTYTLGVLYDTEYTFSIADMADFDYNGGSRSMQITSYKTQTNVKTGAQQKAAVKWNLTQYSTDGTTFKAISGMSNHVIPSSLTGAGSATSVNYVTTYVLASTPVYTATPDMKSSALTNATEVTSRRDLSMYDVMGSSTGSRNTANCYVVRAPGLYKIPCVYGNAIKNGSTNSSAYTSTATADDYTLSTFLNGNNAPITDPWLQNCGATPATAAIVWQDADNLIRSNTVSIADEGGYKYLYFTVAKADIQRGNALLAVKDASGNIQWSWHIWVTDEDFTANSKSLSSVTFRTTPTTQTYTLMSVPLGNVTGSTTINLAERDVWLKGVQEESGKEAVVKIHQLGATNLDATYDGATYYQWGRKDPMPPEDLTGYSGVGRYLGSTVASLPLLYEGIRNPGIFYGGYGSFGSAYWFRGLATSQTSATTSMGRIDNLWSANSKHTDTNNYPTALTNEPVVKTVYDPSPAGWHVPEMGVFSQLNNRTYTTLKYLPVTNCMRWPYGGKNYDFPATGMRNYVAGTLSFNTNHAMFWTAFCYDGGTAVNLNITARRSVIAYTWQSYGYMDYLVRVEGDDTCCYPLAAGLNIMPVADY